MKHAIIIGAMKAGTSSLYELLIENPAICPCATKEPEFFSQHQAHKMAAAKYADLFPDYQPGRHQWCLEASTGYTKYPREADVAPRIAELGPATRLLYIVRHPIERIESQLNYLRVDFRKFGRDEFSPAIAVSRYWLQLSWYREAFYPERLMVLDFDDLKTQPRKLVGGIYAFLDLDPVPTTASPSPANAYEPGSKMEDRLAGSPLMSVLRKIPTPIKAPAKAAMRRLFPHRRHRLSEKQRSLLQDELREDIERFGQDFGFPVGKWGFRGD